MWKLLERLLGGKSEAALSFPKQASQAKIDDKPKAYTLRLGKTVLVDEAFRAWTSGDLALMLKALDVKTNPIDRHFLLMGIVEQTYKGRSNPQVAQTCARIAELHLAEFARIAPVLKKDMGGTLPRVTTFQHYATLLTEQGEFDKAIDVCQKALTHGLHDNTQSGFEGRIERIKKQRAKRNST